MIQGYLSSDAQKSDLIVRDSHNQILRIRLVAQSEEKAS